MGPAFIRLQLPGALRYRDLAVRAVAAACKLVGQGGVPRRRDEQRDAWNDEVVTAFGEAFNNAALHAYGGQAGELEIEMEVEAEAITLRLRDFGPGFDPSAIPEPDLDALPESGLGVFIMNSFMDEVTYAPGAPNVLSMTKRLKR